MAKQLLFSFELEPGMIVSEDVLDPNGRLIIPKNTALDADTIFKLEFFSILEVPVYDSNHASSKEVIASKASENYSQKVKSTPEYNKFAYHHSTFIKKVKKNLNDLAFSGIPVKQDLLVEQIFSLIQDSKNTIQIFDIIHNLDESEDQTYHHSINVAVISIVLGKWLGFSRSDLEQLALAGLLHDVGKIVIPQDILNKTGKLTDEEFQIVRSHVMKGYEILRDQKELDIRIKEACLLHHERCDASGYPFKVGASKIVPFAKIIAIADVYDAMTSNRTYREEFCPFDVIQMFDSEGLYKYDPQYIMTFLENIVAAYLHNNVRLSDGRTGEIIMINKVCLYRPIVQCDGDFIDLMKHPDLKIQAIL